MITDLLILLFLSLIEQVVIILGGLINNLGLPVQLPPAIASAFTYFNPIWNQLQNVFPMDTLFSVLVMVVALEALLIFLRIFFWLLKKIPGIS